MQSMGPKGLAGAVLPGAAPAGAMQQPEQKTEGFFVDAIEGGVATIVKEDPQAPDGFKTEQIAIDQLPPGIKEGDTVMPDGSIQPSSVDSMGIEKKRAGLAGADPGGDIKL